MEFGEELYYQLNERSRVKGMYVDQLAAVKMILHARYPLLCLKPFAPRFLFPNRVPMELPMDECSASFVVRQRCDLVAEMEKIDKRSYNALNLINLDMKGNEYFIPPFVFFAPKKLTLFRESGLGSVFVVRISNNISSNEGYALGWNPDIIVCNGLSELVFGDFSEQRLYYASVKKLEFSVCYPLPESSNSSADADVEMSFQLTIFFFNSWDYDLLKRNIIDKGGLRVSH
jgi:hypothetical protein